MSYNAWMEQWFDRPQQAYKGGVIRRSRRDVDKYASIEAVIAEADRRGWHVIEAGDQVLVFCNEGDMRLHT